MFLGTSSTLPSPFRALPATALKYGSQTLLFDCGEGSQFRIQSGNNTLHSTDLSYVFITHVHADHLLGLPGVILSQGYHAGVDVDPLHVVGPQGVMSTVLV